MRGGLAASPIHQVLLERYLLGWKEIEYEVMRDGADNCITVCNMENIDPMGVHTGDSIVVAPSQTLSDKEYQMLRSASLKIIRALGIEGGCNVQFALAPRREIADWDADADGLPPYYVIEVNPRVSRSSALASKATGYPIARVAAKIAAGKTLDEIPNRVTGKTTAAFEPALDYCVVKIPRWPFDKFPLGERTHRHADEGDGRSDGDRPHVRGGAREGRPLARVRQPLAALGGLRLARHRRPRLRRDADGRAAVGGPRVAASRCDTCGAVAALRHRPLVPRQARAASSRWRSVCSHEPLTPDLLRQAKRLGLSDADIGTLADRLPEQVRELRQAVGRHCPSTRWSTPAPRSSRPRRPTSTAPTTSENEAEALPGEKALVIGSGPIRIGQGIEFDYSAVHAAWALQEAGVAAIMANSNPETVSTDFDTSDRLYFEPLGRRGLRDILGQRDERTATGPSIDRAVRRPDGDQPRVASGARQSADPRLQRRGDRRRRRPLALRGAAAAPRHPAAARRGGHDRRRGAIDGAAHRLSRCSCARATCSAGARWRSCRTRATSSATSEQAAEIAAGKPILIDKYLEGIEAEVDAICDGEHTLIPGMMEHIERAGVHSGDSFAVYPAIDLTPHEVDKIVDYTQRLGPALGVMGLMNVQYVIMRSEPKRPDGPDSDVYVIEVNPRASRTVPFLSKVTGVPMVRLAVQIMLGKTLRRAGLRDPGFGRGRSSSPIKAPVFSMSKLIGVDTYLGPEMKSTGEVMGVDHTFEAALAKALIAADMALPPQGAILLSLADRTKPEAFDARP